MRITKILCLCIFSVISFASCSGMKVADFAGTQPAFDPFTFFAGKTIGHGMFYDRWADVQLSFTAELEGTESEAGVLTLREVLTYQDGKVHHRTYRIEKESANRFQLFSDDLIEPGVIDMAGNALNWQYTLLQDVGGTKRPLRFDDWMFRKTDSLVLNRARAHWYGIFVGEVFMVIEKQKE